LYQDKFISKIYKSCVNLLCTHSAVWWHVRNYSLFALKSTFYHEGAGKAEFVNVFMVALCRKYHRTWNNSMRHPFCLCLVSKCRREVTIGSFSWRLHSSQNGREDVIFQTSDSHKACYMVSTHPTTRSRSPSFLFSALLLRSWIEFSANFVTPPFSSEGRRWNNQPICCS